MEAESSQAVTKSRFRPIETQVDNSNPFLYDRLNRKGEIENLSCLLLNSEAPLVLAIDAAWGSGKTTFMKMWKAYLSKEYPACPSVYFSTWETDFSDDPLHVFLGEVNRQLAAKTSGMTRFKWEKAIGLAGTITKRTLPALAKIATYGVLDLQDVDKSIERTMAELSGGIVSDGLETYTASVTAINQFKENLTCVIRDIGNERPVIVFVDELDRCRPQYAITLIERIKHLLSLPGIVFVLGIDRTQLANAIRGVYGERYDSETYLQRFIDLDYRLAFSDSKAFISKLVADYCLSSFFDGRTTGSSPYVKNEFENLVDVCADVATLFDLSLREIEQLLARVNIVTKSTTPLQPIYPHLLVGLLALRCKAPELYSCLLTGRISTIELVHLITQKWEGAALDSVDNIGIAIACMIEAFSRGDRHDPGYSHIIARSTAETGVSAAERKLMASAAQYISHIAAQSTMRINLDGLLSRIEMAQSFLV